MIEIRVTGNFDKLDASLAQLQAKLNSLSIPLEELVPYLRQMHEERFSGFQRYMGTYKTKWYEEWKIKKNLPVGVKSGDTKEALTQGGKGEHVDIRSILGIGAMLEFGIDPTQFDRGYPVYFDRWLKERGDELVGLTDAQYADLAYLFFELVEKILNSR
jgi:hypothetical protein